MFLCYTNSGFILKGRNFMETVYHTLDPIFDSNSRVLILGSFPSMQSRKHHFYYAHKQNRFWPVLADIFSVTFENNDDKVRFLKDYHLAMWDVIASCTIENSSDQSIRNVECNDISSLLLQSKIDTIFCTGKKSYMLYQKYIYPKTGISAVLLPSPSGANCRMPYDALKSEYSKIKEALDCF